LAAPLISFPSLSVDLTGIEGWPRLSGAWQQLHAQAQRPTFFLSAAWVDAWLAVYGSELDPALLCIRDGGDIVGMALLCRQVRRRGPLQVTRLFFNTAGEGADSPVVEHNALLCAPGRRSMLTRVLMDHAAHQRWDEFVLSGVRRDDWHLPAPGGGVMVSEDWHPSPYVDLNRVRATGGAWLDTLSANTRGQIRRSMRLYADRGPIQLDEAHDAGEAMTRLNTLIELHAARWEGRGKPGAFASDRQRDFHRRLIESDQADARTQLLRISAGPSLIGVLYNLRFGDHVSYYQSGFAYETDNRLKPGLVCHALAIEHALQTGAAEYDFLAAANSGARYKHSLANGSREMGRIKLQRPGLKRRALELMQLAGRKWRS
jgi:CelD/BcsL family acetyltransferase involved in cellulose biosynthesis